MSVSEFNENAKHVKSFIKPCTLLNDKILPSVIHNCDLFDVAIFPFFLRDAFETIFLL